MVGDAGGFRVESLGGCETVWPPVYSPVKIKLISVGTKSPGWVRTGYDEYARRMPREASLTLVEIPAPRHQGDPSRYIAAEGEKMLAQVKPADWVVALDENGRGLSSEQLAGKMDNWRMQGCDVAFCVGGSDGLAQTVLQRANETMSLSSLTFPHYLVRVLVAETLYRAWSISAGHPYHRE